MVNSKRKGKDGELEFAKVCREYGYPARRGQQYNGLEGDDVVGLPNIHIEVKRVERLDLDGAMEQAKRDAGNKMAIVAHRKNHGKWRITMPVEDFFTIYREWEAGQAMEEVEGKA